MGQLSYSITITLLHSIWQAGLLWIFYKAVVSALPHTHPVEKRNAALTLVFSQTILSSLTFFMSYTGISPLAENIFLAAGYLPVGDHWLKTYSAYLLLVYGCVVVARCMMMVRNWQDFRRLQYSQYLKAPANLKVFTQLKAAELGIRKNIRIWLSPNAVSPLTFGFWKPVILLPAALVNKLTIEQAETLILHELSHIKNNDYLLNWLLLIAEIIFFFNPFILFAIKEIKKQRELACDIKVLEFTYGPVSYAEALLKTAQLQAAVSRFLLAASQDKDLLLKRILFFTSVKHENLKQAKFLKAALLPFSFLMLWGLALINAAKPAAEKEIVSRKILINTQAPANTITENPVSFGTNEIAKLPPAEQVPVPEETAIASMPETTGSPASTGDTYNENEVAETAINLLPVAYEPAADSVREVIVTEENSAGNSVTRSYKINFKNGKWNITLLWITVDKKSPDPVIINDKDSSSATD
ncbi:MAG: M56 family metallopeptidase [Ferruginibacter sp.]